MRMTSAIRRCIPQGPLALRRRLRDILVSRHSAWRGVYAHYRDVPRSGAGFSGDVWVNALRDRMAAIRGDEDIADTVPPVPPGEHGLLALLAATVCRGREPARILDFGGGLAEAYVHLRRACVDGPPLEYHVVETPEVCAAGAAGFAGDGRVRFHDHLPDPLPAIDIVYVCTALQYVEDYRSLLVRLCGYRARYLLLAKTSAGDIPTFATAQVNVRGSVIPYWFLNAAELVAIVRACGYAPVFREVAGPDLRAAGLPRGRRLRRCCNLLFVRTASASEAEAP